MLGLSPEEGVSAIQVAARGLAKNKLGRIDEETTANIGIIKGGIANNIIPDKGGNGWESKKPKSEN